MKENRMKDALENIARRDVPEDVNLMPRIAARLERKSLMSTLRARPALMIVLIVLSLILLTGAAYALGRSLGYIPGVGVIDQGVPLRVLKEPVSVTRDGITVTVQNVVITSNKTSMKYYVDGVPQSAYPEGELVTGGCIGESYLLLPNGTKIYEGRFLTTPVPADAKQAVFVIPCISNTLPGSVPENWELPLQFVPASPELTVIPVTVVPAPTINSANSTPIRIMNVLDVGDSFVLMGEFDNGLLGNSKDNSWWVVTSVKFIDANGAQFRGMASNDFELPTPTTSTAETWVYQVKKNFVPPLTISYDVEHIIPVGAKEQAEFEFDAGQNLQARNEWIMNKSFKMGGYNIQLTSIAFNPGYGYSFNFKADPGASANKISVDIVGYTPTCGGGGGADNQFPIEFSTSVCFWDPATTPKGKLTATLSFQVLKRENQTFKLNWSPAEPYVTLTPKPGLCLTLDATKNDSLPSGLGGKLLTTVNDGNPWSAVHISSLDGTQSTNMGHAAWPSLSNDGTKLAYSVNDGIHIHNLLNGENHAIGIDGYKIMWSPDNTRILFTNTRELYIANVDGSGVQKIDTPSTLVVSPTGWTDNQTVWYTVMGGDGFTLISYNLQSGETKSSFKIHNKAGYGAISPDGQWIVFADRVDGAANWGIYIARLDGSERQLVVDPQVNTAFASYWSPDAQWLLINTSDADNNSLPVLVNPFTCQVARLNNINGMIEGWSP